MNPQDSIMTTMETDVAPGFHKVELLRTSWEMPVNYTDPQPLGVGAYGQVWYATQSLFKSTFRQ